MTYTAIDVLVVPSYADKLPNRIRESMTCETPCVVFDKGGNRDLNEFCNGLEWVLNSDPTTNVGTARNSAAVFHNSFRRVSKYLDVYKEVQSSPNSEHI